ncbi:MAG: hypothetical protein EZS28_031195 [Streblomastix strix]|uniref:Protein kinase domain-containing protein n=1 Tax=Streblomastix strix TaxID=222440 RepID=A0A5J4US90_9EUKA|nr:MAG: hypothetical protein EZS28_031195 [Streblomastix strix]
MQSNEGYIYPITQDVVGDSKIAEDQYSQKQNLESDLNQQPNVIVDSQIVKQQNAQKGKQPFEIDFEQILRQQMIVPIRPLDQFHLLISNFYFFYYLKGRGAFGIVYLVYDHKRGFVANKIILKQNYDKREWEAAENIHNKIKTCPFIMNHIQYQNADICSILVSEFSNMQTLDIIAKQPQISLPMYIFRALMKQILEGIRVFHSTGLVHRDIKCNNILLHNPRNSRRVHAKIADFGFSKKEEELNGITYVAGTIPYMAPEMFKKPLIITQKVDMYAVGITFYHIITKDYPIKYNSFTDQSLVINEMPHIERPAEIQDNILWDLLSQLLEFDPTKRLTAEEALQHPFFIGKQATNDISQLQIEIARQAEKINYYGSRKITEYDLNPSFIVPEPEIKKFYTNDKPLNIRKIKD